MCTSRCSAAAPILVWAVLLLLRRAQLIGHSVNIWVAGALTLSLNSGAYLAEIVRGAVQSVDSGQMEAHVRWDSTTGRPCAE